MYGGVLTQGSYGPPGLMTQGIPWPLIEAAPPEPPAVKAAVLIVDHNIKHWKNKIRIHR